MLAQPWLALGSADGADTDDRLLGRSSDRSRADSEWAVLVLSHVLEHLDEPEAFLTQFSARFGFVYIEVPDFEGSAHNLLREQFGLELSYADADHISEFGRAELENLAQAAGLRIVDVERIHGVQRLWCDTAV